MKTGLQTWAAAMVSRSVASAAAAIVRLRYIYVQTGGDAVCVKYDYLPASLGAGFANRQLAPLRSPVLQLHFREGQFGGCTLPTYPDPIAIQSIAADNRTAIVAEDHKLAADAAVYIDNATCDGVACHNSRFIVSVIDSDSFEISGVLVIAAGAKAVIRKEDVWLDSNKVPQTLIPITGVAAMAVPGQPAHFALPSTPPIHIATGDLVYITGVQGSVPAVDGVYEANDLDATDFTITPGLTTPGQGGSVARLSILAEIENDKLNVRNRALLTLASHDSKQFDACASVLISGVTGAAKVVNGLRTPRPGGPNRVSIDVPITAAPGSATPDWQLRWMPLSAFELAPPQVIGVQPIREDTIVGQPWGLSTLRVVTRITEAPKPDPAAPVPSPPGRGAIGRRLDLADSSNSRIWWQTLQHEVQYRTNAEKPGQCAGLPANFRARAMDSLLPVNPRIPLPAPYAGGAWQPVLPGDLTCMIVGTRAGVLLGVRSMLLTQLGFDDKEAGNGVVSGGLPIHHRMPRPQLVPPNGATADPVNAVQTWGSYFAPTQTVLIKPAPFDEAFAAESSKNSSAKALRITAAFLGIKGALSLKIEAIAGDATLQVTGHGFSVGDLVLISGFQAANNFNGVSTVTTVVDANKFTVDTPFQGTPTLPSAGASVCRCAATSAGLNRTAWDGNIYVTMEFFQPVPPAAPNLGWGTPPTGWNQPDVSVSSPASNDQFDIGPVAGRLGQYVCATSNGVVPGILGAQLPAGTEVDLVFRVSPVEFPTFIQELRLPLRIVDASLPRLPIVPRFLVFEDPEYNRHLATAAAQTSAPITVPVASGKRRFITVQLSADRRQYNPNSTIFWRFDVVGTPLASGETLSILTATFQRLKKDGTIEQSVSAGTKPNLSELTFQSLQGIFSNPPLDSGDQVQLVLTFNFNNVAVRGLALTFRIVSQPINPPTQAAYGINRRIGAAAANAVDCPRFAWGPNPDRVVLVNPEDLKTGIVRRRAVFRWSITERPDGGDLSRRYAIQKIAANGGTHFPF